MLLFPPSYTKWSTSWRLNFELYYEFSFTEVCILQWLLSEGLIEVTSALVHIMACYHAKQLMTPVCEEWTKYINSHLCIIVFNNWFLLSLSRNEKLTHYVRFTLRVSKDQFTTAHAINCIRHVLTTWDGAAAKGDDILDMQRSYSYYDEKHMHPILQSYVCNRQRDMCHELQIAKADIDNVLWILAFNMQKKNQRWK